MLDVTIQGLAGLKVSMERAGDIPDGVLKEMVNAQAEVVEKALIYNAGTMLRGPYYAGGVARSVTRKKARRTKTGASAQIIFKGMQHGNRLGEIAFVNEFGKKGQPARPFIRKSNDESAEPAADAARKVLDAHLQKNGL